MTAQKGVPWWHKEHPLSFIWEPWNGCNYRCSYCFTEMDGRWEQYARDYPPLPAEAWLSAWDRIHSRYGTARISWVGGEPLLCPGAEELVRGLSRQHLLMISTNLSVSDESLEAMLGAASPESAHFNPSFHPQFADPQAFLRKALRLQAGGYDPTIVMVAWPPFLPRLTRDREWFGRHGLATHIAVFEGRWQGREYPAAYSCSERELIASFLGRSAAAGPEKAYRLRKQETRGKLCHAGRIFGNIKGNGNVFRCGMSARQPVPLGNLLAPDFRLLERPSPCPFLHCACLEFRYLDEVWRASRRLDPQ